MSERLGFVSILRGTPFLQRSWKNRTENKCFTYHPSISYELCTNQRQQSSFKSKFMVTCSATTDTASQLLEKIESIAGEERGIFGMDESKREELETYIAAVEAENPCASPTDDNAKAAEGKWRLIYTNLQILGRKRVRLAIGTGTKPGFVQLGDFFQIIDSSTQTTKNEVEFKIMTGGYGTYTISADYSVLSANRVEVTTVGDDLQPEKFERLLGERRSLLLKIFNPQGYLDITYLSENLRIGRDNKGLVFVLEKFPSDS